MSNSFVAGDPPPFPAAADTHGAWCAAHGRVDGGWAVGASVIGRSHLRRYRPRDDAFALMAGGGYLTAVVCDGVGGELYSRIGAAHCANTLCRELLTRLAVPHVRRAGVDDFDSSTWARQLAALGVPREPPSMDTAQAPAWINNGSYRWNWNPFPRAYPTDLFAGEDEEPAARLEEASLGDAMLESYDATRASFLSLAGTLRVKPRELTCTVLAVVWRLNTGEALAAQPGDGAILTWHGEAMGEACPASPNHENGNPFTIADGDWREGLRMAAVAVSQGTGLLLMTDGAAVFFSDAGPSCRELLQGTCGDASTALQLLGWLQKLDKGCLRRRPDAGSAARLSGESGTRHAVL